MSECRSRLDGADRAPEVGALPSDAGLIKAARSSLTLIGVTDDGVIYVGNLTTDATNATTGHSSCIAGQTSRRSHVGLFRRYLHTPIPSGSSPRRFGDSLALRGHRDGTQILLGTYTQVVGLLTTADGVNFTGDQGLPRTPPAERDPQVLGWVRRHILGKQTAGNLRQFSLNWPPRPLQYDQHRVSPSIRRSRCGCGRSWQRLYAQHTLRLYDIINPAAPSQQDATKTFPAANANGNWIGCGFAQWKLFALDVNNGILAYSLHESICSDHQTQPATSASGKGGVVDFHRARDR